MRFFIICTIVFFSILSAWGASFDCEKAKSHSEKLICSHIKLSKLDEHLARAYREARKFPNKTHLKKEQIQCLKDNRDSCQDTACMIQAY